VGLIKGLGAPVNLFQHPSFEELFFLKHRPQERRETMTGSSSQLANEKRPCQTHVTPKSFINSLVTSERDFFRTWQRWQLVITGAIVLKVALFVTVLRKAPRSDKTLLVQSSVNIRKLSFSLYSNLHVTKLTKMFSKYLGKGYWRPLARFRNLVALDLTED